MKITGPPSTTEQEEINKLQGKWIHNDQVQLLTAPKWEDGRWTALANAFGSLCFIEVSLSISIK